MGCVAVLRGAARRPGTAPSRSRRRGRRSPQAAYQSGGPQTAVLAMNLHRAPPVLAPLAGASTDEFLAHTLDLGRAHVTAKHGHTGTGEQSPSVGADPTSGLRNTWTRWVVIYPATYP